ncbi:MAG: hypothetical protein ACO4AU_00475 [bacterium]|jgi:hypothetical protein
MRLSLLMESQPDDVTCGPTSLHAVYRFLGDPISLPSLIQRINQLEDGGTLAVLLGIDALRQGYQATLHSFNLQLFDPSWSILSASELAEKLKLQLHFKKGKKFTLATEAYREFVLSGGQLRLEPLSRGLLQKYLSRKLPILTGLSATYLYQSKREYTNARDQSVFDDLRGEPMGHFVVIHGMEQNTVFVADPYHANPLSQDNYYEVDVEQLMQAIMLGVMTYDGNLLILSSSPET